MEFLHILSVVGGNGVVVVEKKLHHFKEASQCIAAVDFIVQNFHFYVLICIAFHS